MTRRTVCLIVVPVSLALIAVALLWKPETPALDITPLRVLEVAPPDLVRVAPSSRGAMPPGVLRAGMSASDSPTATPTPSPTTAIPSPTTQAHPTATALPTRSVGTSLGMFRTSGYTDCDAGMDCRGITASGQRTRAGVIAVDPRVIPLRTVIQIAGMGEFVALDTGGGIQGNRIDIWFASRDEALRHGVQSREVWLR